MANMNHRGAAAASMEGTDTCPLQHQTPSDSPVSAQTGLLDAVLSWGLQPSSGTTCLWDLCLYPYPVRQKVHLGGDLKIGQWIRDVGKQQPSSWEHLNGTRGWKPDGGGLRSEWEVMKLRQKGYRLIFQGIFFSVIKESDGKVDWTHPAIPVPPSCSFPHTLSD